MKILFIVNPTSGSASNNKAVLRIHEMAIRKRFDFKFLYTNGKDDDETIRRELDAYQPDRVIAGGGDGTVQLVARNLIGKEMLMGILPLGSANGLATALGFPQNPVQAVDAVIEAAEVQRQAPLHPPWRYRHQRPDGEKIRCGEPQGHDRVRQTPAELHQGEPAAALYYQNTGRDL
jgi:hypothetical protein